MIFKKSVPFLLGYLTLFLYDGDKNEENNKTTNSHWKALKPGVLFSIVVTNPKYNYAWFIMKLFKTSERVLEANTNVYEVSETISSSHIETEHAFLCMEIKSYVQTKIYPYRHDMIKVLIMSNANDQKRSHHMKTCWIRICDSSNSNVDELDDKLFGIEIIS